MKNLKILNSKEKKALFGTIEGQWGVSSEKLKSIFEKYAILESGKEKIYIVNKEALGSIESLRIDSVGIYFAARAKSSLRLSIEGSQIIGRNATKNIAMIKSSSIKKWMSGESISLNDLDKATAEMIKSKDISGFVIIRHKNDFMGCGKDMEKDKKILNYIPKARRISAS